MYIVSKVYDDGYAELLDLVTYSRQLFNRTQLKAFARNNDVKGLTVGRNGSISYIQAYDTIQFISDTELMEYISDLDIKRPNKLYINGYYWLLIRKNEVIHVKYFIHHYTEIEETFVTDNGYTANIKYAKCFSDKEVYAKAQSMNKIHARKYGMQSSNYWQVLRVAR